MIQMGVADPYVKRQPGRPMKFAAGGCRTIRAFLLRQRDVLVFGPHRWRVVTVEPQPCEIAPKVQVRAWLLPDGPIRVERFDAETYVAVEVSDDPVS